MKVCNSRAPGHIVEASAIGILAVLHGMNAQSIDAFFGEAHSEIPNAEALDSADARPGVVGEEDPALQSG